MLKRKPFALGSSMYGNVSPDMGKLWVLTLDLCWVRLGVRFAPKLDLSRCNPNANSLWFFFTASQRRAMLGCIPQGIPEVKLGKPSKTSFGRKIPSPHSVADSQEFLTWQRRIKLESNHSRFASSGGYFTKISCISTNKKLGFINLCYASTSL